MTEHLSMNDLTIVGHLGDATTVAPATTKVTRLNVNVNDETAEALKALAEQNETTVTEIVRRAVSVYKFIEDEHAAGKRIALVKREESADEKVRALLDLSAEQAELEGL